MHLVFGVWGLVVYRNPLAAILYARVVAIAYAVLLILGLIPGLDTVFGLVPIHSNNIWLHALLAAGAAYFGLVQGAEPNRSSGTALR